MKGDQSDKTKVVVRHLPPTLFQPTFMAEVDAVFAGRYNWASFRPGKTSQKHQSYSRAYIDFKRPEDVIEFAEFFNDHLFVNEKGAQFRAVVEYAPSQNVPKQWSKKDGREGTIYQDPEYLEFVDFISKPMENLPSAEIQLERREAEKAGAPKDAPIITPLMDFVRKKRAAKSGSRRIMSNGKLSRRASASGNSPGSSSSRRGFEKKRMSTKMYVLRDAAKSTSGKDKSSFILVSKRDDSQLSDKAVSMGSVSGAEALEEERGQSGITEFGKKKILLLKGKEKEILPVSGTVLQDQNLTSSDKGASKFTILKQNQRHEPGGGIIRSILVNKDSRHNQSSGVQFEQHTQLPNLEKEKRPPRPSHLVPKDTNGIPDDKLIGKDLHSFRNDKQEKRTRNRGRHDRVAWTPLLRSDGSYMSEESFSSTASQSSQLEVETSQASYADIKVDMSTTKSGEVKTLGSGGNSHSSLENGLPKHFGRRGPPLTVRDFDGSTVEGKLSKRGSNTVYGSHESQKQVWVQKSSSGS